MTGELARVERDLPVVQSDAAAFMQVIERASRDPSVDIDKMERLLQMQERMMNRQAETAFNAALAEMQTELPEIPRHGEIKNKSGGVQSKYAKWEDLNEIIKPILSRHGFALSFRTGNEGARIVVTGILSHAAGHSVSSTMHLPLDTSGSKNEVQGLGSSTSYGKRYVAGALLNLTSRGEDDDGAGGKVTSLSDEQKKKFRDAMTAVDNLEKWSALWGQITAATTACGDVASHEELRSEMAALRKGLK